MARVIWAIPALFLVCYATAAVPFGEPVEYGFFKRVEPPKNLTANPYGWRAPNSSVYQQQQVQPLPYPQQVQPPPYPQQPPPLPYPPQQVRYPQAAPALPSTFTKNVPSTNRTQNHDLIMGKREPGDEMLAHMNIFKEKSFWGSASKEITFPGPNFKSRVRITQFAAYDQAVNGTGGVAKLKSGGPGSKNVTIKFKAQSGFPLHFLLEVYGWRI